jgi:cytochrome c nitrite reductase small subunit
MQLKLKGVKHLFGKIKDKLKNNGKWFFFFLILILFGFLYAGSSIAMKATDQAAFCSSCHVMNQATRTYMESVHANLSCNDCHAPQQPLAKIAFKSHAGINHLSKYITGDIPDVIEATPDTRAVVNQNCLGCHQMTNINVAMDAKKNCTDCHRHVPHFPRNPIRERMVAGE